MALTYNICQRLLPPFESAPNPLEIGEEVTRNPGVDVNPDLNSSAESAHKPEVADILPVTEGRGSRKRRGKHPSTLYECDCGEIITESDIERGEGLIECNKAGCETRWVSPWFYLWRNGGYLLCRIVSHEMCLP